MHSQSNPEAQGCAHQPANSMLLQWASLELLVCGLQLPPCSSQAVSGRLQLQLQAVRPPALLLHLAQPRSALLSPSSRQCPLQSVRLLLLLPCQLSLNLSLLQRKVPG